MSVIKSVIQSTSNAALLEAAAALWIRPDDKIIDLTWGKGVFWKGEWSRHLRVWHDPVVDYTNLEDNFGAEFDVAVFDPPYVAKGGRETSGIPKFDQSYGLRDAARTPKDLVAYNTRGVAGSMAILKPGGRLFLKCADYISSGRYQTTHHDMVSAALRVGFEQVDEFILVRSSAGPQPKTNRDGSPRRQVHSRRVHSFLCIFQKPSC